MKEWIEGGGDGDCFPVAAHLLVEVLGQGELVHGVVSAEGVPDHIHAWVELGDVCMDQSNGHNIVLRKEAYYAIGRVRNTFRYDRMEAMRKMAEHGHYGPWEDLGVAF